MKHTIMCSCGKLAIQCKEASEGLNTLFKQAKKEVFDDVDKIDGSELIFPQLEEIKQRHLSNRTKKKQYVCFRCSKIFYREKKYASGPHRRFCENCKQVGKHNKGKRVSSPKRRLGLVAD